jgi:aspartokinase/homoserine dehydrogenase 1
MLVLKFGGTSVGSPQAIRKLIDVVRDTEHSGSTRVVVVSAFSKITDSLIEVARLAEADDGTYLDKLEAIRTRHLEAVAELCAAADRQAVEGVRPNYDRRTRAHARRPYAPSANFRPVPSTRS